MKRAAPGGTSPVADLAGSSTCVSVCDCISCQRESEPPSARCMRELATCQKLSEPPPGERVTVDLPEWRSRTSDGMASCESARARAAAGERTALTVGGRQGGGVCSPVSQPFVRGRRIAQGARACSAATRAVLHVWLRN
eukprot:5646158-Prymnesium_polylepis.3